MVKKKVSKEDTNFIIKHIEKTNPKFGCEPHLRTFDELLDKGVLVADKNAGPTSHETTDFIKKILKLKKAGHSGTLDPQVTGVLVVGLERATRLMEYMLKSNKEYVCLMYIHKPVTETQIKDVFKKFTGKIMQLPPIISAVRRQLREREIYYIDLLDVKDDGQSVLFKVGCQHGTYIRKLCSDIGVDLGVGAQMKELRRTKAGPFKETDDMIGIDRLRNLYELYLEEKDKIKDNSKNVFEKELRRHIKPMEDALVDFKKVYVRDSAVDTICHGADLAIPGVLKLEKGIEMGEEIAMLTAKGELIGMGIAFLDSKDVQKKRKGAFVKTHKVFMDIDIYPRKWVFEKESIEKSKKKSVE